MIQITLDAHSLDEEFEAACKEAGITILDRTLEPWSVIFEGERLALYAFVEQHWGCESMLEAIELVDSAILKQPHQPLHEYAFDVKLFAVVRVKARTLEEARAAMDATVDAMEPDGNWVAGFNSANTWCKVTEVSLAPDDAVANSVPFQIDGVDQ